MVYEDGKKTKIHAVIKYFVKNGIESKFTLIYTTHSAPSYSTVVKWTNEFICGWESLKDDTRSGWPKCVTTQEIIAKEHKMILENRWLKVLEIAEGVGMSFEWAYHILSEQFIFISGTTALCGP